MEDAKFIYIIVKIGWKYNDETYDRPEDKGSGEPVEAFYSKDKADLACAKKNKDEFNEDMVDWDGPITELYEVVRILAPKE